MISLPITYREYAPAPPLARHVACYWHLRAGTFTADPLPNRVLPDGCADIIFDLAGRMSDAPFVVGTMRSASLHRVVPETEMLGIRFRPGGAYPFLSLPLATLTDLHVDLAELWRDAAAEITDRISAAASLGDASLGERIGIIDGMLLRRLREPASPGGLLTAAAVELIEHSGGRITVAELERTLGAGRRRLERTFAERIGVGPKLYARIVRLQTVLPLFGTAGADWQEVVHHGGYYDQSHLIAEVKDLAGITPTALGRERVAFLQSAGGAGA